MIKITDPSEHAKKAILDANDNPVKLIADHFKIVHFVYDETPEPHVIATCARCTKSGEKFGPRTQFHMTGEAFDYLMREEGGKKKGNFRIEDIEDVLVRFGSFPGADFRGKLEHVK